MRLRFEIQRLLCDGWREETGYVGVGWRALVLEATAAVIWGLSRKLAVDHIKAGGVPVVSSPGHCGELMAGK